MIMIVLLFFACSTKTIHVGTIDVAEQRVCTVQLVDETIIELESKICNYLQEGDTIHVVRVK